MDSLLVTDNSSGSIIIEKHFKPPQISSSNLIAQWWPNRSLGIVKVESHSIFAFEHNGLFILASVSVEGK